MSSVGIKNFPGDARHSCCQTFSLILCALLEENPVFKILLVEDNQADAILIQEFLTDVSHLQFKLTSVQRLGQGLEYLRHQTFDIILLDLSLPDSRGLETLTQIIAQVPQIPIVILTAIDDEQIALESVRQGAQDYLVKGRFEGELLVRAIRYAIERHRIEATLRLQAQRERLLGRMLEKVHQSLNLVEILRTTVADIQEFLQADRVLIYRCQPGTANGRACFVVECATQEDSLERLDQYAELARPCFLLSDPQHIYTLHSTHLSELETELINVDPHYQNLLTALKIQSAITVPILQNPPPAWSSQSFSSTCEERPHSSCLWGFLMVHQCQYPREWQQWEIDILKQLASQLSIAIQQSELYCQLEIANQQLQRLAMLDGLTGIANRRQFDQVLQQVWQQLGKERKPLSLILCDIDYFKPYNDHYGHLAGDQCLQQVAMTLEETINLPLSLVARYGGEEFAIILPRTEQQEALEIAQSICKQMNWLQIPHPQSSIYPFLTLSLGVTTTIPDVNRSPVTLVDVADQALYTAKSQGRNRIVTIDYPYYSYSLLNS